MKIQRIFQYLDLKKYIILTSFLNQIVIDIRNKDTLNKR